MVQPTETLPVADIREYPARPICGVGVVVFSGDSVLLVQRGKEPRRGEWSIPGGAVEIGETVRDAALREVAEECGAQVALGELVDVVDLVSPDNEGRVQFHYILVDFWGEWKEGTLAPASDVMDARWVRPLDLDTYCLPTWTRAVIDKAVRVRAGQR